MSDYKNPFDLLKDDHSKVKSLFEELEKVTANNDRKEIWKKISKELAIHTAIEEQYFYPKLESFKELHDMMLEAVEEHNQVDMEIAKLEDTSLNDEAWMAIVTVIKEDLLHHIKEEEEEVFPLGSKLLVQEEQEIIVKQMLETKEQEA